jgi:negative regulator of flagellin synthesis FlgM
MSVKINSTITSTGSSQASGRAKPAAQAGQANRASEASASGEKVELSALSSNLQQASALSSGEQVMDISRVAEIKQAIAEGRFQIKPERIANGLLDSVREMLAKQA